MPAQSTLLGPLSATTTYIMLKEFIHLFIHSLIPQILGYLLWVKNCLGAADRMTKYSRLLSSRASQDMGCWPEQSLDLGWVASSWGELREHRERMANSATWCMRSQSQALAQPEATYGRISKWYFLICCQIEKSRKIWINLAWAARGVRDQHWERQEIHDIHSLFADELVKSGSLLSFERWGILSRVLKWLSGGPELLTLGLG